MKNTKRIIGALLVSCILSTFSTCAYATDGIINIWAAARTTGKYSLRTGDPATIQTQAEKAPINARFLGRIVRPDGVTTDYAYFESSKKIVHMIPASRMSLQPTNSGKFSVETLFPIVRSVEQEGETCMAYTLYNSMRQLDAVNGDKSHRLTKDLASEGGRMNFIVRMINEYYIESTGYDKKVMEFLNNRYGVNVERVDPKQGVQKIQYAVTSALKRGIPVLMTFEIPKNMWTTDYLIRNYGTHKTEDRRLWQPKEAENKSFGGHAVLGVSMFQDDNGEWFIVVVDPNWELPRLWRVSELSKIRGASMTFWTIRDL